MSLPLHDLPKNTTKTTTTPPYQSIKVESPLPRVIGLCLLLDEGLVGLGVHQLVDLLGALLVDLDADDPAAAVAVVLGDLVDGGGLLLEQLVGGDDLAAHGGVDVGGALDRLDGADGVALVDEVGGRRLGQLHVDDVAELLGGVRRDADDARLAVGRQVDPLVVLGVLADEACAIESHFG